MLQRSKIVLRPQISLSFAAMMRNALYVSRYAVTSHADWSRASKLLEILMRAVVIIVVSIAETKSESHSLSFVRC